MAQKPRLPLRWVEHLKTPKERDSFFEALVNNRFILGRLKQILEEEYNALEKTLDSDYESPSWAFHTADLNGQKRQIKKVLDLLSFL